jgi:hypothetical protein
MTDEALTDSELYELDGLIAAASPAPWTAFAGAGIGGPDFIRLGGDDDSQPDSTSSTTESPQRGTTCLA